MSVAQSDSVLQTPYFFVTLPPLSVLYNFRAHHVRRLRLGGPPRGPMPFSLETDKCNCMHSGGSLRVAATGGAMPKIVRNADRVRC